MVKEDVLLLDFWASPFCNRVKIALAEKGVAYEHKEEDLFGGKSELLLKSNPIYQKVPVLLHDGKPMCESTNIVLYIDETWPSPPLLPSSAYDRARTRFWVDFIDKKVRFIRIIYIFMFLFAQVFLKLLKTIIFLEIKNGNFAVMIKKRNKYY